jgi:hypothetical protein
VKVRWQWSRFPDCPPPSCTRRSPHGNRFSWSSSAALFRMPTATTARLASFRVGRRSPCGCI